MKKKAMVGPVAGGVQEGCIREQEVMWDSMVSY